MSPTFEHVTNPNMPMLTTLYHWPSRPLTEDRIEREAERLMDKVDAMLMSGHCSQAQYDRWCKLHRQWIDRAYNELKRGHMMTDYDREQRGILEHSAWYDTSAELA